jgi:hypothetical protein
MPMATNTNIPHISLIMHSFLLGTCASAWSFSLREEARFLKLRACRPHGIPLYRYPKGKQDLGPCQRRHWFQRRRDFSTAASESLLWWCPLSKLAPWCLEHGRCRHCRLQREPWLTLSLSSLLQRQCISVRLERLQLTSRSRGRSRDAARNQEAAQ